MIATTRPCQPQRARQQSAHAHPHTAPLIPHTRPHTHTRAHTTTQQSKDARNAWLANPLREIINGANIDKYLAKKQELIEDQETLLYVPRTK